MINNSYQSRIFQPFFSLYGCAQETDWIRVSATDAGMGSAGGNRGHVFIPEKGDQVLVGFMNNNPDQPVVVGALFNGKTGEGGGTANHLKTITTRSGNTVIMDDDEGSITTKDACGNTVFMDGKGSIIVTASTKDITINAPETITLNAKNIRFNASEDITASAGQSITSSAGDNISDYASNTHNVFAKDINITASDKKTVKAKNITKTAEKIEANSTKENLSLHSKKQVVNKSGEKVKLF